jgi:hypothetical protein
MNFGGHIQTIAGSSYEKDTTSNVGNCKSGQTKEQSYGQHLGQSHFYMTVHASPNLSIKMDNLP